MRPVTGRHSPVMRFLNLLSQCCSGWQDTVERRKCIFNDWLNWTEAGNWYLESRLDSFYVLDSFQSMMCWFRRLEAFSDVHCSGNSINHFPFGTKMNVIIFAASTRAPLNCCEAFFDTMSSTHTIINDFKFIYMSTNLFVIFFRVSFFPCSVVVAGCASERLRFDNFLLRVINIRVCYFVFFYYYFESDLILEYVYCIHKSLPFLSLSNSVLSKTKMLPCAVRAWHFLMEAAVRSGTRWLWFHIFIVLNYDKKKYEWLFCSVKMMWKSACRFRAIIHGSRSRTHTK